MMRHFDLCSGIGGFSLGLEATGAFKTVAFCDFDPFCRRVLKAHWPGLPIYRDVNHVTARTARPLGRIDIVTAGFPCQSVSVAGRQLGDSDQRWLWPEIARVLGDLEPRYALLENVAGLLAFDKGRLFGAVLAELAALGYDAEWHCVPAAAVGAAHIRDRLFIFAHRGRGACEPLLANTLGQSLRQLAERNQRQRRRVRAPEREAPESLHNGIARRWLAEPLVCRGDDDVPDWVDQHRTLGNAVVPDVVEAFGYAIVEANQ